MATTGEARPLRFAVVGQGDTLPAWQVECIERLLDIEGVELALRIVPDGHGASPLSSLQRAPALRSLASVLGVPAASREVDATAIMQGVPRITCEGRVDRRFRRLLDEREIADINAFDLDFILDLDTDVRAWQPFPQARFGVWAFHHADSVRQQGGLPGFWEVYRGDPVMGAELWRLSTDPECRVLLASGSFKVVKHSPARSVGAAMKASAAWPARVCTDIRNGRARYVTSLPERVAAPEYAAPNPANFAVFIGRLADNGAGRVFKALFRHEQWNVGIVRAPISAFLNKGFRPEIEWLPEPGRHMFRADAFGIRHGAGTYLFYERFKFGSARGGIGYTELDADLAIVRQDQDVEFRSDVHLSYPFMIQDNGEIYCIPETHEAGEVALYRAVQFPDRWEKVTTLLSEVPGCDPTVFRFDGRWWMTFTRQDNQPQTSLQIWHAADLQGPWQAHERNPVKMDVRSSRPAGTPFVHEGMLYRPAQDSSRSYGGRVVINRVLCLTPTEFEEEPAAMVDAFADTPYANGVHTLSSLGDITIVDAKRLVFDHRAFMAAISRGFTRGRGTAGAGVTGRVVLSRPTAH